VWFSEEEGSFSSSPLLFFFSVFGFSFLVVVVFLLPVVFASLHPPLPTVLLPWVVRLLPLLAVHRSPFIVLHEAARIFLGF
jgi:hypothetical protein